MLTPSQTREIPFETYHEAYTRLFPKARTEIDLWRTDLVTKHGTDLTLRHYVADIGLQSAGQTVCVVRENFAEKFGESFLVPSEHTEELAFGRVFENFIPASDVG